MRRSAPSPSPSPSPSAEGNAIALQQCWHPVAFSTAITAGPAPAELLGSRIVLWRDGAGTVHAHSDLCIHRGTALSLGSVRGNELVCPYHGWRYAASGQCVAIPQLEDPTRVPRKARIDRFRCQERYGLVWVALDEPRWELPEVPELESGDWKVVNAGPYAWHADSSRQVENFTDFGHFPWVHPGLLGDPARPVVPAHTVRTEGHVLHYEVIRPEAPGTASFPVFANAEREAPTRRSRYELHLPYTIVLRLGWGGREGMVYFFVSQPVDRERSVGYVLVARNYNFDQPDKVLQEFEDVIFNQDQRIVESQRPEIVPFDLADELHLRFDAVAVAYRRAMRAHGLAAERRKRKKKRHGGSG
ncbi:MAG TPA: aromatic ring-hydroxylating dioxygenase subunit alpha [Gemmatimonadales bacterium]|nr:aromatic ring-hydroxylating dioxygenase subunit alpha [Gemmatimonadales bacterium]